MTSPSTIPCRFCHKLSERVRPKLKRVWCVEDGCPIRYVYMTLAQWEAGVVEGKTNDRCNIIHPEKLLNPNQRVLVIPLEGE